MTTQQIQKEVKKVITKNFVKKNEVFSWNFKGESVTVTMQTTCGMIGESMEWGFIFDYEEGNRDCFTEYELAKYPEMIEESKVNVYQVES